MSTWNSLFSQFLRRLGVCSFRMPLQIHNSGFGDVIVVCNASIWHLLWTDNRSQLQSTSKCMFLQNYTCKKITMQISETACIWSLFVMPKKNKIHNVRMYTRNITSTKGTMDPGVRATVVTAGHCTHTELTSGHALAGCYSWCVHSRGPYWLNS